MLFLKLFLVKKICFIGYYKKYFLLLVLAVAIAVAISCCIAILAIFRVAAIAIVVAVFALVHVDAVYKNAEVGEFLFSLELFNKLELVLAGVAYTAHIDAKVCDAGDEACVCHHAYGGGVENHVVELLFELFVDCRHRFAFK